VLQRCFVVAMLRFSFCAAALLSASAALTHAQAPTSPQVPAAVTPQPTPTFREVTDEMGRTIRIPQTIRRIVSLAPNLTETLYALGLQDRLVGDTDYCDFPEDAQHKPKVGGVVNPSIEAIVALHPDLVLVTKISNRQETVNSLADLGIPSYATDPHTIEQIISSTQRLALLIGEPEAGDTVAKDLQRRLADLHQRIAPLPRRRVFFIVWTQPLISIGRDTFIADALRYAGADSVVDSPQSWPQLNLEEIAKIQPDFLVFAGSHTETMPVGVEALSQLPGWRILDAVRNHRYANVSEAIDRPAPRIVSAIEDLARQFHPEAFPPDPNESHPQVDQQPPAQTDQTFRLTSSPRAAPAHPESPRLLGREGSAFPSPQPRSILLPLASRRQSLLEVSACAR
jgi:iron complex transport system substrate-binding protein